MALTMAQLRTIHHALSDREAYCKKMADEAREQETSADIESLFYIRECVDAWTREHDDAKTTREAVLVEMVALLTAKPAA